jgi:hypothetical protein
VPPQLFLLIRIALIQNNKPDYKGILTLVLTLAVLGLVVVWLGHLGLDLARTHSLAKRLGGGLVLLVAVALLFGVLAIIYWAAQALGQLL